MRTEPITLADLVSDMMVKNTAFFRLALRQVDGVWILQTAIIDIVSQTPRITWSVYDYGQVAFIAGKGLGVRVASWLKTLKGKALGYHFQIPKLQEQIYGNRYPSYSLHGGVYSLRHPYTLYQISLSGKVEHPKDTGLLIAENCPSFPSFEAAAYRLLYDREYQPGQVSPEDIIIRMAHHEAWIERLQLHPSAISIRVEGAKVSGVRLEISGTPNFRVDKKLRKSGFRRFTIPQGLPPRLWVLISRGNHWLDYRELDLRESSLSSLSDNVVIDLPDVCVEISGLISRGESEEREFKEEVSGENKKSFLKTVCAFANGKGGVVLIGVVDNTGEIRGIKGDVNKEKDRLTNMIRDNVVPQPNIHIQNCKFNGKHLIAIYVEEGDSPPYGLDAAKPTFYVRRGATTFQATQHEIRTLAKKHNQQDIDQYWKY